MLPDTIDDFPVLTSNVNMTGSLSQAWPFRVDFSLRMIMENLHFRGNGTDFALKCSVFCRYCWLLRIRLRNRLIGLLGFQLTCDVGRTNYLTPKENEFIFLLVTNTCMYFHQCITLSSSNSVESAISVGNFSFVSLDNEDWKRAMLLNHM